MGLIDPTSRSLYGRWSARCVHDVRVYDEVYVPDITYIKRSPAGGGGGWGGRAGRAKARHGDHGKLRNPQRAQLRLEIAPIPFDRGKKSLAGRDPWPGHSSRCRKFHVTSSSMRLQPEGRNEMRGFDR